MNMSPTKLDKLDLVTDDDDEEEEEQIDSEETMSKNFTTIGHVDVSVMSTTCFSSALWVMF